ncbi:MAG TPA: calcium-binding protein [Solirubrobacteraceae bacterium]|nr:calcium-binding protein [Solirubrobacteraceae bacterium]
MKPLKLLAALATALAATFAVNALPADAAATSAETVGNTATLNLDGADDNETVSVVGGLVAHTAVGGGLNSAIDWDSATPGDQTVPADGTFSIAVDGGDGNDSITVLAKTTEVAGVFLSGGTGDDVLTGADTSDSLDGGDGNDRLVGGKGTDKMNGGAGNDTLVWNNGDGSDTLNGDAGNDGVEVNGSPTLGDAFTLAASAGRVQFQRTNLVPFTLDASAERFEVNGLGGNDSVSASDGVGALTLLSVDGGAGDDVLSGSDGPDLLQGGEGNDVLSGGGGDDRIVGDRGSDTMNGGPGDDTLVWNNGDGSDVVNDDDGSDDVEVNGAPAAGDIDNVQPNGARIRFDRTNLVPFTLDIGTSETMHDNALGGDDSITVGDVGAYQVTADGGAGNDTLTGGPGAETFLGGTGNDTIDPGDGIDVVDAGDGDDQVNVRDKTADLARGGNGNDSVTADAGRLDILDGFENVDRTPNDPTADAPPAGVPPVVVPPVRQGAAPSQAGGQVLPVTIRGGTSKVKRSTTSIKLSCPAASPGNCTGSLVVRTATKARLGGRRAVLRLGSARYDIAAGSSKTLKVKLARGIQRLADRRGRLAIRVIASTGASGQTVSSSRRLTLDFGTRSRKH